MIAIAIRGRLLVVFMVSKPADEQGARRRDEAEEQPRVHPGQQQVVAQVAEMETPPSGGGSAPGVAVDRAARRPSTGGRRPGSKSKRCMKRLPRMIFSSGAIGTRNPRASRRCPPTSVSRSAQPPDTLAPCRRAAPARPARTPVVLSTTTAGRSRRGHEGGSGLAGASRRIHGQRAR